MTVDLDQKVALPDGSEIRLTSYKKNELGTYIYYEARRRRIIRHSSEEPMTEKKRCGLLIMGMEGSSWIYGTR